jgi:adenylylsulfate kinase-like enzyme
MPGPSIHLYWNKSQVTAAARDRRYGQVGVVWFTGLSGSGKSTIAGEPERRRYDMLRTCLFDLIVAVSS